MNNTGEFVLRVRGAFKSDNLELYEFDQFEDNLDRLGDILGGDKIDVYIDDGFHSDKSILTSLRSVRPHLAEQFICIIEDNCTVADRIAAEYPEINLDITGELTGLIA